MAIDYMRAVMTTLLPIHSTLLGIRVLHRVSVGQYCTDLIHILYTHYM